MNLATQLREAAARIETVDHYFPKGSENRNIFYLRPADNPNPGLVQELENKGFSILTFMDADDMEGKIRKRLPDGIIVDAAMLPLMYAITPLLASTQDGQLDCRG